MRCWILYILVFGLCAGAPAGAPQPDAGPTNFSRDAVETPIRRTGDHITLKSGKVLHGVKIVRRTSLHLVLEILPEIKPLLIPVRQVAAIEYGTLEPRSPRPGPDPGPATAVTGPIEPASDVFNAVKVSPELIEKMGAPFTPDPIDFENQDIVNVLRSISILSRVNI
ncbi:MAG: hypothetical protein Q8N51_19960, partial [Gammaproteobacteria bacterium]|nr:hypothetical protein [Gammaproteobacteria bacterium]